MTPKERAEDLVSKYKYPDEQSSGNIWAKQCAIICVEQIIPCTWEWDTYKKNGYISVDEQTITEYWEEVLQILKNS